MSQPVDPFSPGAPLPGAAPESIPGSSPDSAISRAGFTLAVVALLAIALFLFFEMLSRLLADFFGEYSIGEFFNSVHYLFSPLEIALCALPATIFFLGLPWCWRSGGLWAAMHMEPAFSRRKAAARLFATLATAAFFIPLGWACLQSGLQNLREMEQSIESLPGWLPTLIGAVACLGLLVCMAPRLLADLRAAARQGAAWAAGPVVILLLALCLPVLPVFNGTGEYAAAVVAITLLALFILLRAPTGVALGLSALVGLCLHAQSFEMFSSLFVRSQSQLQHFPIIGILLLVFMGQLALHSGIVGDYVKMARTWLGRLPGGFSIACAVGGMTHSQFNGDPAAGPTAHVDELINEMDKSGHSPVFALGSMALGQALGNLVFPGVLVTLGALLANESAFMAYFSAHILHSRLALCLYVLLFLVSLIAKSATPRGPRQSFGAKLRSLFPPATMNLIVVGGCMGLMLNGIATLTEAAASGVVLMFLHVLAYRRVNRRMLANALHGTVRICVNICLILLGAYLWQFFWTFTGLDAAIIDHVLGSGVRAWQIMLCLGLAFLVLGGFMRPIALFALAMPLSYIMLADLGMNGSHTLASLILLAGAGSSVSTLRALSARLEQQAPALAVRFGIMSRFLLPAVFVVGAVAISLYVEPVDLDLIFDPWRSW